MNTQWSDKDIESLLTGREPTDGDLARLAPLIEALKRDAGTPPTSERVVGVARMLAEAARDTAGQTSVQRATETQKYSRNWRRRLILIGGGVALATVGVGGAAVASDGAAPGDFLYPVDQALETVGIGNGGTGERIHEAIRLADRGRLDRALNHAALAVEREGDETSAQALLRAAVAVENQGAEQSIEVRTQVSEMLRWMESSDAKGKDFGQGVAERAQSINDNASHGMSGDAPGRNPDGTSGQNPGNTSGQNPGDTSGQDKGGDQDPGKSKGNSSSSNTGKGTTR